MNPRNTHVNKTPPQRKQYWKYIESQDYEPTVDEKLRFARTGQGGEELGEPSVKRRRRIKLSTRIGDHLSENWVNWLFAIAGAVLLWLMTGSKVNIASLEANQSSDRDSIKTLQETASKLSELETQQMLQINENRLRIDFLDKEISRETKAP